MRRVGCSIAILAVATLVLSPGGVPAQQKKLASGAFEVAHELELPGTTKVIFDAITGDISGWWDHSFSENPKKLYIEPKPGGGFWEIFDEQGNGVRHATVTFAQRGKMLRFEGPLGLAGNALHMVHTYEFIPVGAKRTLLRVTVRGAGQMEASWPDAVDRVWKHFLFDRFMPYVESGKHLN